ncbi:uncharacterized protein LOC132575538, partial [Heteronotia binoei]|uniref:uncharacterized protein LOC132575538 n=1 Tax=Heteronotia binoei TaxID=13085 RepID=UPI0029308C60
GYLEPFDPTNPEGWESYAERVEFYLRANKITDAGAKRDVLMSVCGPATFEIAKGLSAPARLAEKSYDEIIRLLTGHFSPQPSRVARRFLFHKRDQIAGESAADYLAALRKLSHAIDSTSLQVLNLPHDSPDKIKVTVLIEGNPCQMEVDSGSSISLIAEETLRELCPRQRLQLRPADFILRDFQKNPVQIAGWARVQVERGSFHGPLDILVVKRQLATLLGLAWFKPMGIRVEGVGQTLTPRGFGEICKEFPEVFDGSLGSYRGPAISLPLDPTVRPIRLKARRVPFALKPKIEAELDRLTAQGVLEPVDYATWETPIVTPIKPTGEVRICADYKCTINKALQDNPYPVPVVSHVLAALAGARIFGKLDLAQAYQQLPVDSKTAEAQTIVTHRGAFRVKRLQFGVSVAPGIFQSIMDSLLKGIPGVQPFFDDVLVAAPDPEEFGNRLREVLRRFQTAGLKVKREKCLLGVPRVEFLGFAVDATGIHPTEEKTRAIVQAPTPTSKAELQSFLGVLNFYHSFLPHKAALAEPLHRLLDKKAPWVWGKRQAAAFQAVKDVLVSNAVLHHFDEALPVILACDASPYGVGAVLGHQLPDGREVPVAYYSRTLTPAERNYAQIDKEALAIVAGVRKFHEYLYGRRFTIATDHKPLLGLLAPDRQTPQILSQRVLRWNQFLNSYTYTLVHRAGKTMGHADALSRLPLPETGPDPAPAHQVMMIESLPEPPLHAAEVAKATQKHKTLARVLDWVVRGWPEGNMGEEFRPYKARREELAAHKGCILWGSRVVIPPPLQRRVLESLHETHPGINTVTAGFKKNQEALNEMKIDLMFQIKKTNDQLADFQKQVLANTQQVHDLTAKVERMEDRDKRTSNIVRENQTELMELEDHVMRLEMEKAATILRFQNLPEEKEEDLISKIIYILIVDDEDLLEEGPKDILWAKRVSSSYIRKFKLPREVQEQQRSPRWSLNLQILKETKFLEVAKKEIQEFFKLNVEKDTKIPIIWDAFKAFFRGVAIRYSSERKREQRKAYNELITKLKHCEKQQKTGNSSQRKTRIMFFQHQINALLAEEIEKKLKWARQNYFENANKVSRWLAYRLRKEKEKKIIKMLKNQAKEEVFQNSQLKEIIQDFYRNLYKKQRIDLPKQEDYIKGVEMKQLTREQKASLENPISIQEIVDVIRIQKSNKTPGPDGLPIEFFRAFEDSLLLPFKKVVENAYNTAEIPDSWKEALITLIHKEGTDPSEIKNYRPISLLNSDYKVYAAILANRLKKVIAGLIHEDQTGFVPGRLMNQNVRLLLNAFEYYREHPDKELAAIFVDAEKAFDNVNWNFIKATLSAVGCGERYSRMVEAVYSKQAAKVSFNGVMTDSIEIEQVFLREFTIIAIVYYYDDQD